jgi:hypothetical protein
MRTAARADSNQAEIVAEVRRILGDERAPWIEAFRLGKGAPDAVFGVPGITIIPGKSRASGLTIAGSIEPIINDILTVLRKYGYGNCTVYHGANLAVEIKDGSKSASAQQLTEDELGWHECWQGQIAIWRNIYDVREGLGEPINADTR